MADRRRWVTPRRLAVLLILVLVVEYLVIPQLTGARDALDTLSDVTPGWLALGTALELAAIGCYARLTYALLPEASRPSFRHVVRTTLATLGLSHVVPGGSAVAASSGYRLLTRLGVKGSDVAFALATQSLGSAVVLNTLLWLGLVVSIPLRGYNPLYGTAALLGALLLGAVAAAVILLTRGEERVAGVVCRTADRVPFVDGDTVARALSRVADRLRDLSAKPKLIARAAGWAAANWLLDAASLWVFLAAFGHRADVDALIVAFGLANIMAAIPITPGGLGVVEATLVTLLVGFGGSHDQVLLGVVSYRLVNFWLPIPVGAVAYLGLRLGMRRDRRAGAEELERLAEQAQEDAPRRGRSTRPEGSRLADPVDGGTQPRPAGEAGRDDDRPGAG